MHASEQDDGEEGDSHTGIVPLEGTARRLFFGTSFGATPNVISDDVHHDIHTLTNGNLSLMRYDVRADRLGDKLQEVTRTGEVVWEWKSLDHIDVPVS